jgi:anti-anti-sigma factor
MADSINVVISETPRAVSVRVRGDVDIQTAPQLQALLDGAIERGARLVLLDLSDVDFLDSSGLRVILAAAEQLRALEGSLLLEGASPAVAQVLEMTGVIEHLRHSADEPG